MANRGPHQIFIGKSRIHPQMSKSHYLSTWKEHHFSWLDHSDSMAKFPCFYDEMSLQKPTSFTQGFPTQVTMFVGQIPFNLHSCWVRCIESSMVLSVYWYLPFFCFEDAGKSPCWFLRTVPWKITCLKCVWKIPCLVTILVPEIPFNPHMFLVKNRNPHVCCLKFHGNPPKMVVFPLERLLKCPSSPGELTGYRPKPRRSRSRRRNSQDSSMRSLRSSTWISLEKRVIHGENIIIIIVIIIIIYTCWWFEPSWKIWVRQWEGLTHIWWKIKKCSKPPISIYIMCI